VAVIPALLSAARGFPLIGIKADALDTALGYFEANDPGCATSTYAPTVCSSAPVPRSRPQRSSGSSSSSQTCTRPSPARLASHPALPAGERPLGRDLAAARTPGSCLTRHLTTARTQTVRAMPGYPSVTYILVPPWSAIAPEISACYAESAMRIIFTDRDLAATRLAEYPNPLAETVLSVRVLRRRGVMSWLDPWRSATRARLTPQMRPLLELVPADGWVPDFLGGTWSPSSLSEALDRLRSTSEQAVQECLAQIAAKGRPGVWRFAAAGPSALGQLAGAVAAYHHLALAPQQDQLTTAFDADRAARARALAGGGIDLLLATLHPAIRWNPPVLEITGSCWGDEEFRLTGGGLLIYPAVSGLRPEFAGPVPGQRTGVLINPVASPRAASLPPSIVPAGLPALLGSTRAGALHVISHAAGCTTTELARQLGITPTTASHHAAILRNAGLITTQRHRNTVLHTLTPLGTAFIDANTPRRARSRTTSPESADKTG
jgi:DNA-binding transcriptional ArsR family regulator